MQNKIFAACSVLALIAIVGFSAIGCSTATSVTTTTNGTVGATQLAAAQSGVLLASGAASIGVAANTVGGMAGISPTAQAVHSTWMRGFMGNPPPAFFTQDMTTGTASVDGYFNPLATPAFGGKMTPYIRLRNTANEIIKGDFFANKKIADLTPCTVEAIFAGSPTQAPHGITAGIGNFMNNYNNNLTAAYVPIKYMGDYLCWAYIYPTMEVIHPLPGGVSLTTPLALYSDKIGSMDNKMVYTGPVNGEIVVNVPCELSGQASLGTSTGTGKLTTAVTTVDVTTKITFTSPLGNPPTLVTVIATNETAPLYTTIVYVTSPTTGVGTGEIWDYSVSPVVQIGTLTTSSTGGSVTVGVTTETFTF